MFEKVSVVNEGSFMDVEVKIAIHPFSDSFHSARTAACQFSSLVSEENHKKNAPDHDPPI